MRPTSTIWSPRPSSTSSTPIEPVTSPEAGWLRGEPGATPLDRSGPVTVWRLRAALDPDACGPANTPLRRVPRHPVADSRGWVTSSAWAIRSRTLSSSGRRACARFEALSSDPAARRRADRIVGAVQDELRRRIGPTFRAVDLAELYSRGTDWCLQVAFDAAPGIEVDPQSLADAAFWFYLRGAEDFAGGRQLARD